MEVVGVDFLGAPSTYVRSSGQGVVGLLAYDVCAPLTEAEYDQWLFDVHYHDLMSNPHLDKISLHTVSRDKKARLSSGAEVQNSVEFFRLAELHFQSHDAYTRYIEYFQANAIPPPRTPAGKSAFKFYLIAESESISRPIAKPVAPSFTPKTPTTVLVVGSSGNIGQELTRMLRDIDGVTVLGASRSGDCKIDINDIESVRAMDIAVPNAVDHVVVCCGASTFGPLAAFDSKSWVESCGRKFLSVSTFIVMLVNGVEVKCLKDGGSLTVTTGQAARTVNKMWPGIAANNAGLEAMIKCAGVDAPRGVRLNSVAPAMVSETAQKAGMPTEGTVPAAAVAAAYLPLIFGTQSGQVVDVGAQVAFQKSHHAGQKDGVKVVA